MTQTEKREKETKWKLMKSHSVLCKLQDTSEPSPLWLHYSFKWVTPFLSPEIVLCMKYSIWRTQSAFFPLFKNHNNIIVVTVGNKRLFDIMQTAHYNEDDWSDRDFFCVFMYFFSNFILLFTFIFILPCFFEVKCFPISI